MEAWHPLLRAYAHREGQGRDYQNNNLLYGILHQIKKETDLFLTDLQERIKKYKA